MTAMYAVKVRPATATAWFWLREWQPLKLTTLRNRAAQWLSPDGPREIGAELTQDGYSFQVVRIA